MANALAAVCALYTSAANADDCRDAPEACVGAVADGTTYTGVIVIPGMHVVGDARTAAGCTDCEWLLVPACSRNGPDAVADLCPSAALSCAARGEAGTLTWVFVRRPGEPWTEVADVCIAASTPVVTLPDLQRDARRYYDQMRPGAATITTQPTVRSLVNLPTYFQARGTTTREQVFGPAGLRMTITAAPAYAWQWGDATPDTVTNSPGGPYPSGDVRHTYSARGTPTVTLTTRWTATFTVTTAATTLGPFPVPGPEVTATTTRRLDVREARAVLVGD